jgi:hypothetical protein
MTRVVTCPPIRNATAVERTFELASVRDCRTISAIERQLMKQGYEDVALRLEGMFTRSQIRALVCEERSQCKPLSGERAAS